jgi:hypothetical protein
MHGISRAEINLETNMMCSTGVQIATEPISTRKPTRGIVVQLQTTMLLSLTMAAPKDKASNIMYTNQGTLAMLSHKVQLASNLSVQNGNL